MPISIYEINRKYSINENYFENIDTEEKAYWLGFIWADGSITKTAKRCSGPNRFTLAQKIEEIQHLTTFAKTIASDVKIHIREPMPGKKIASLDINSRPFCMNLEKLGYGTKAVRIHIPNMQKNLRRHFIRGYFDGDGCLSLYEQYVKKWTIQKQEFSITDNPVLQYVNKWVIQRQEFSITGNPVLISEIQEILNQETSVAKEVKPKSYKRTAAVVSLRYGKKADIDTLFNYLYNDATIYLESKHEKFIEYYSRQSKCGLQSNLI